MRSNFGYSRWRWKRRAVMVAVVLCLAYPACEGPVHYAAYRASCRGWFPFRVYLAAYDPLYTQNGHPRLGQLYGEYILWWNTLAWEHEGPHAPERLPTGDWD